MNEKGKNITAWMRERKEYYCMDEKGKNFTAWMRERKEFYCMDEIKERILQYG